ncbi:MAG: PLP-dependent aminotransferase family protein [Anaerolineales bacterium]|nr:PLP-dependent aminotransferase family protein [Anaerolineales bacterium]
MSMERHFSDRARRMQPLAIRDILQRGNRPGVIPFIAGQPVPELFPMAAIGYQAGQIFATMGPDALQYGNSQGYESLLSWVAERHGVKTDNVLIISGSQQALDLAGKLFIMPGDKVVIAAPTYAGALGTFAVYGAEFLTVPCDEEGMLPDALAAAMAQEPRLVYAIPNYMNPTGINMSLARRRQLASLAQQYDVPILEDDPYGELRFEGERLPNLLELAPEHVIYASTFSKIMAPGLRLAWVIAPDWAFGKLLTAKQTTDLQSATYTQRLLAEVLEDDFLEQQIGQLRAYYRSQRDMMISAIEREFPAEVKFTRPTGGMFVWCELPAHLDATALLEVALNDDVAYMPGAAFYHDGSGRNTLRLSFTLANEAEINQGIATLGRIFRDAIRGVRD